MCSFHISSSCILFWQACVPLESLIGLWNVPNIYSVSNLVSVPMPLLDAGGLTFSVCPYAVVTCEVKLFWNKFEIILVFYFTCNHVWNWNKIISAAEGVLKLFQNCFSDNEHVGKYSWAAISLRNNFEIISGKSACAEIKLFQTDVDAGWNNFEIIFFHV